MNTRVLAAARALGRAAALVGILGSAAASQTPLVQWDSLGLRPVIAFTILPGPDPTGSRDVLLAFGGVLDPNNVNGYRMERVRRLPSRADWQIDPRFAAYPEDYFVTASGAVLAGSPSGPTRIDRSTDGGLTWTRAVAPLNVYCFLQTTGAALRGAVYACGRQDPNEPGPDAPERVWRSLGDGAAGTWEPLGTVGPPGAEPAGFLTAMAELPPTPALPAGRLVVGVASGIAVSDDGGRTWAVSRLWENFHWWVYSLALARNPAHPYGGTLLAGVGDFVQPGNGVWSSDDGGMTWTRRVTWRGISPGDQTKLAEGPGGAVYAATLDVGPRPARGTVHRTLDGGRTWEDLSGPGTGWGGYGSWSLHVGRDGRVYAATDAGVWATRDAVLVSGEAAPAVVPDGVGVAVRPNPTAGRVEVVVSLAEAQDVRVAVFDALGREVAVVLAGPVAAGERAVPVDTSAWPAGVYVIRVVAGVQVASARLVVAR